ncbi:cupin domain-containing protein [Luteibacter flocculans]|uniref:Cupin domain-containing protein n=1 Tax=Luteibacter flocculans TaxID=2780091 RepID=A0ABY4SWA5_9GAMM|nr:ChrR family anti-sigma-E factor [Luteibacter flocculans]URL56987.1 cupin domain-containing protein [Luteibacter flocculans]
MKPHHHLDAATLMSYSAGAMPAAFAAVVSAHLSVCPICRDHLLDADAIGGQLLSQQEGMPLSDNARERLLARLGEEDIPAPRPSPARPVAHDPDDLPMPLWPYFGRSYRDLPWKWIGPGIHHIRARGVDDGHLMLLRVAPGRSLPMHTHGKNELTMILRGAYDDSIGHFAAGDVADLDSDIEHQPVTAPGVPCVCVAATDAPLRFSGWLARSLQPLFKL